MVKIGYTMVRIGSND